jgi:putative ABC transport system permease protein
MFANYFLIALQGLRKQPVFSVIKILSLAIGLGCSILVIMHVQYTYSFDKHIDNWQNSYRLVTSITTDQRMDLGISSDAYAPQLELDYVDAIAQIARIRQGNAFFSRGDDSSANPLIWAEPDIIDIFDLEFTSGDPAAALGEPNVVALSESVAEKYFPGEDPLGQTLTMDDQVDLRVTGVYRDVPENTHIEFPMLVSAETGRQRFGEFFMGGNAWVGFGGTLTYLTIPEPVDAQRIQNDMAAFVERNLPDQQRQFAGQAELTLALEPLADVYLSPRIGFGGGENTRTQVLAGLSIFAVLILLTSCINFANLSLSQVQQRAREIGVRKTLGAKRGQIVWQFLAESLLLTLIALLIALPAIYFAIPAYTTLTDTGFTLATAMQNNSVLLLVAFVLATGILSGILPAFALSRFEPASIIHGITLRGRISQWARSGVTVIQFGFSTALIIFAVAITLQINFLNTMAIGFNKDNLVVLDSTYSALDPEAFDYDALVNELRQHPGILAIGKSNAPPPNTGGYNPWRIPSFAPNEFRPVSHYVVDAGYADAMQFEVLAGRTFSAEYATDFQPQQVPGQQLTPEDAGVSGIVITRYAVSNFGFDSPEAALDEIFLFGNPENPFQYRVIGVIEDFRLSGGLEDTLRSTSILRATEGPLRVLLIRIEPNQLASALDHIDTVWSRHRPDVAVNRTFYDQTFGDIIYNQTNGISKASLFASVITIIISAFGLYALAFYSSQRRTKEVGIRKVLGATSKTIVRLLTWDFVKPVLVACVLACGAGYFAIGVYFEQFSSQVSVSPVVYLGVTLGTIVLAILTVAIQCYRAANADPVESLRYE